MTPPLERLAWIGIAALATARLTRFFTSDKLGEWLIVGRVKRWASQIESPVTPPALGEVDPYPTPEPHWGWRSKLVSGLEQRHGMAAPGRSTSTGLILEAARAADMKLRASTMVSRYSRMALVCMSALK